jgi:hypothetical protein
VSCENSGILVDRSIQSIPNQTDDVAAIHVHPSTEPATASDNSSISSDRSAAAASLDCLRHSFLNFGARVSGTQRLIWRNPSSFILVRFACVFFGITFRFLFLVGVAD